MIKIKLEQLPKNYQWSYLLNQENIIVLGKIEGNFCLDIRAQIIRKDDGNWQYTICGSPYWGIEPSAKLAKQKVEQIIEEHSK